MFFSPNLDLPKSIVTCYTFYNKQHVLFNRGNLNLFESFNSYIFILSMEILN
jgi:hypothetical protein